MFTSKVFDSTFLPAKFSGPTTSTKVMIIMHGIGDHKGPYKELALELNQTGLDYLLLNAPTPYYFGFSWYDLPPKDPIIGIQNSTSNIKELVLELNTSGYKSEDIFIAGFSQGGCIAIHSFLEMEETFAGVVCMSPRIYLDKMNTSFKEVHKSTPIFIAHGYSDQAIPFEDVKDQTDIMKKSGLNIEWHEYSMGHEIAINEVQDLRNWLIRQL